MGLKTDLELLKNIAVITPPQREALLKSLSKIKLLTPDFANTKTAKSSVMFSGYVSYIMHLSPADIAFKALNRNGTLCPMASAGCKAACLNTAGRGRFNSIQESRLRKTLYFILFKDVFMSHLEKEIARLETKVLSQNKKLVLRLNGTSDVQFENIKLKQGGNIFERFSSVQFYDYTAIVKRLEKKQHDNYYLIFSAKEDNDASIYKALNLGFNVAMVFNKIPELYNLVSVINGDTHDFRFLDDGRGIIVGLNAKGKAKKDLSGFVRQASQCGKVA